jgi:hypothetical protein
MWSGEGYCVRPQIVEITIGVGKKLKHAYVVGWIAAVAARRRGTGILRL